MKDNQHFFSTHNVRGFKNVMLNIFLQIDEKEALYSCKRWMKLDKVSTLDRSSNTFLKSYSSSPLPIQIMAKQREYNVAIYSRSKT